MPVIQILPTWTLETLTVGNESILLFSAGAGPDPSSWFSNWMKYKLTLYPKKFQYLKSKTNILKCLNSWCCIVSNLLVLLCCLNLLHPKHNLQDSHEESWSSYKTTKGVKIYWVDITWFTDRPTDNQNMQNNMPPL